MLSRGCAPGGTAATGRGWYKIDHRYQIAMYKVKLEDPWKVLGFIPVQE